MDRLTSMRVFLRVIDEGSFAAAARVLDMSPAVVTRLVADLEEHLGTRLLHRTTRKQSLTEAGDTYVERVRMILQDLDEAHAMVSSQTQDLSGVLRISSPPAIATHILAPLLAGFRAAYPNIFLDIEVATHREPPIEDFDITLMGVDQNFDGNVVARKIIASEGILVASPAYLARKGAPRTVQDLLEHDCLRSTPNGPRNRLWRLFRSDDETQVAELDVKPVLWANHADTLMRSSLDGAGITVAPVDLAAPHITTGALIRVLNPWITSRYTLYAALPSRKFLPQRTHVFVDYLTEQTRANVNRAMMVCEAC
jgi:DNA-binding transcriptional LysR family regulator